MNIARLVLFQAALFYSLPAWAARPEFRASQKVFAIHESYSAAAQEVTELSRELSVQITNRLMSRLNLSESCQAELAALLVLRDDSRVRFELREDIGRLRRSDYRATPLAGSADNADESDRVGSIEYSLDRLLLACQLAIGDLTIGRQAISLGASRIISPNDVILPYGLLALDQDYRPGVDAIRLRMPMGPLSELDLGLIFDGATGEDIDPNLYLRYRFPFQQADWSLIGLAHQDASMLGLSYSGQIVGTGFWTELSHMMPSESDAYFRFSAGAEHYFANDLYTMLEYHFNQPGMTSPAPGFRIPDNQYAYSQGGVFLAAQHYLGTSVAYPFSPLIRLQAQVLQNIDQNSQLVSAIYQQSLADEWTMRIGGFMGTGRQETEFALYPSLVYLEFEVYF